MYTTNDDSVPETNETVPETMIETEPEECSAAGTENASSESESDAETDPFEAEASPANADPIPELINTNSESAADFPSGTTDDPKADVPTVQSAGSDFEMDPSTPTYECTIDDPEKGPLNLVITGYNRQDLTDILDILEEHHKNLDRVEETSITDAEKRMDEGYDSLLCWAAEASNLLWLSGWATHAFNPYIGEHFRSEDEIMALFADHYEDLAGDTRDGIQWFFNGVNIQQNDEDGAHVKDYRESDGWLRDYVLNSDFLQDYNLGLGDSIEELKQLADGETVAGISIYSIDPDGNEYGSHALTLAGYITDADGNIVSLFVTDSEDNMEEGDEKSLVETRTNAFIVYDLKYDDVYGYYIEYHEGWFSPITELLLLRRFDNSTACEIMEYDDSATKNAVTTPDLIIDQLWTTLEENGMTEEYEFRLGDDIYLQFNTFNRSYVDMEEAFFANVCIYKDDSEEPIVFKVPIDHDEPLSALGTLLTSCKISDRFEFTAGSYRISIDVNPADSGEGRATEAYYVNNASASIFITILDRLIQSSAQVRTVSSIIMLYGEHNNNCTLADLTEDHPAYIITARCDLSRFADLQILENTNGENVWAPVPEEAFTVSADPGTDRTLIALSREFMESIGPGAHTFRASIAGTFHSVTIQVL